MLVLFCPVWIWVPIKRNYKYIFIYVCTQICVTIDGCKYYVQYFCYYYWFFSNKNIFQFRYSLFHNYKKKLIINIHLKDIELYHRVYMSMFAYTHDWMRSYVQRYTVLIRYKCIFILPNTCINSHMYLYLNS